VLLWESLTGKRLFDGANDVATYRRVLEDTVPPPSAVVPNLPAPIDGIVLRGLARDPTQRFQTARDMAVTLETAVGIATPREIGRWVEENAAESIKQNSSQIAEIDSISSTVAVLPPVQKRVEVLTPSGQRLVQPVPTRRRSWLLPMVGVGAVVSAVAGVIAIVSLSSSPVNREANNRGVVAGCKLTSSPSTSVTAPAASVSSPISTTPPPASHAPIVHRPPTTHPKSTHPSEPPPSLYSRH
jgi:serine/threonine-protein kinase